jgi:replicative DNA helicase
LTDPTIKQTLYKQHKSGVTKFPTGRPELDAQFGGWNSKDYVVIFARLGIGKSWIAEFFAYCLVKSGLRVGYYSGEMSAVEVSLRLDTFHTNLSNNKMFTGNMSEGEYEKVSESFSQLPGKFFCLTPEELGGAASVEDLKRFIENQKLQALFIDQFSLLKRNSKLGATEASAKLAEDLRVLQAVTGVPFFIVSQQNRQSLQDKDSKNKDDLMASISLTDGLGQNATLAFALDYNQDNRVLTLNLAKNRRGKVGKFQYLWDIDKGVLGYIPVVEDDGTPVEEDNGFGDGGQDPF